MQDPENMSIKEVEDEYAALRKKSNCSGKHQARASQLLKFLMEKRKSMEPLYEVSEVGVETMPVEAVVKEFKELRAEMNRPNDASIGWYGYAPWLSSKMADRVKELRLRLSDEFIKNFNQE